MAKPEVRILITANSHDAESALRRLQSRLRGLGDVGGSVSRDSGGWFSHFTATMAGFLGAQVLDRIADGIKHLGSSAIESAAQLQDLRLGLETLVARELARGKVVEKVRTVTRHLTAAERAELKKLTLQHQLLAARLQEEQERHRQLVARYGQEGLAVKRHAVQMEILRNKYEELGGKIQTLKSREGALVKVIDKVRTGQMSMTEAMKKAGPKADELLRKLQDLSLISPYEYQTVAGMFRMQMAFGQTSDMALKMTRAILDASAGLGLSTAQVDRMAYALGEINMTGRVSAIRLRELRMVGIDMADVFQTELGMSVEQVNAALKSGKLTMKDVSEAFIKYSKHNFAGAAQRMSQTWHGLMSSFHDLWFFASKDLMTPLLERMTKKAQKLWAWGKKLNESGGLKTFGQSLANAFDAVDSVLESALIPGLRSLAHFGKSLYTAIVKPIHGVVQAFGPRIRANVAQFAASLRDALSVFRSHAGDTQGFIATLEMLAGRLLAIASSVLPMLGRALQYVADHWDTFSKILMSLGALIVAVNAPLVAIAGAVAALALAWDSDWGGIQEKTSSVWAVLQPILQKVGDVLSVALPAAGALAKEGLSLVISGASAVWNFLTNSLIPTVERVVGFFQTDIPNSGQSVSNSLLGVVQPAFDAIAGFLSDYVFPILSGLADVYLALVKLEWRLLAALITNVVIPALKSAWKWVKDNVIPVLQDLADKALAKVKKIWKDVSDFITNTFVPAVKEVIGWLMDHLNPALDSVHRKMASLHVVMRKVKSIVDGVSNALHALAEKLRNLNLPDWLKRHSPSEIEVTLSNVHHLLRQMPRMSQVFDGGRAPVLATGALAGAGATVNHEVHYHLEYTAVRPEPGEEDAASAMERVMLLAGAM